jgi:peroxiredoxin
VRRRNLILGTFGLLGLSLAARSAVAAPASGRPWLGVAMESSPSGTVLVSEVIRTSPAEKLLQKGDTLLRVDGVALSQPSDLVAVVSKRKPGMTLAIAIRRGGRERTVDVVLGTHPGDEGIARLIHVGKEATELDEVVGVGGAVAPRLADRRGKVVVLEFFAGWCTSCRAFTPQLAAWHKAYEKRGLSFVGVTSDDASDARRIAERWKIPYPVGSDPDQKVSARYRISALPTLFVIDRKGVIRDVVIGYDPKRREAIEKLFDQLLQEKGP